MWDVLHPDPFGVTVVLMEEDGYRISLTEAFARWPHRASVFG